MLTERYQAIVRGFRGLRIAVLGDLMMDEYLWGKATRISPESPVMVVEVDHETSVPGGAANVVNNLLALGAEAAVCGVVGDDAAGTALRDTLSRSGADTSGVLTDSRRPTTRKTRVVAHHQQVLRIDRERTEAVSDATARELTENLVDLAPHCEAILLSDYNKGVLSPAVVRGALHAAAEANIMLAANPKPAIAAFLNGAGLLTVNQTEAEALAGAGRFTGAEPDDEAGHQLREFLGVERLVVTRGNQGLSAFSAGAEAVYVAAHPVEVYDVAGAGDTVICALTLALAAGASLLEAATVANHAAALVVRKLGVATVTQDELLEHWDQG